MGDCVRAPRGSLSVLPQRNAALQQGGADLIDNAGALADQALPHPVQSLQVELIRGLRRHELHRWTLHRLGDRLRIAKVILLLLRIHDGAAPSWPTTWNEFLPISMPITAIALSTSWLTRTCDKSILELIRIKLSANRLPPY